MIKNFINFEKKGCKSQKTLYICNRLPKHAKVAQLVERQPSKLNVAGSNPVFRSKDFIFTYGVFFFI